MGTDLNERLDIRRYDTDSERKAKERFDHIAKPIDGLGVFEDLICRIAGIQGRTDVDISKRIVVIMCADNGITEEGISQTSWEVTAKVAGSMSNGRSSVCLMAESAGADTLPVDIGIKQTGDIRSFEDITEGEKGHYRLLNRKVANGTYNFAERPAMTGQQFDEAFFNGVRLAGELSERGYQIICTGEMGIGNTTTAAGITSALLELPASGTAGRGSGLSDEAYERKIRVLDQAIQRYDLYRLPAREAACAVGGYDIAALAGIYAGGAIHGIPVVIDGVISAAAALLSCRLCPGIRDFILPSHLGAEKSMVSIMRALDLNPPIHAGMKLGEGTGAVMLLPMLDLALSVYRNGAGFDEIRVDRYERMPL